MADELVLCVRWLVALLQDMAEKNEEQEEELGVD